MVRRIQPRKGKLAMAGVAAATAVGMGVTPGLTAAPAIAASTTGTAEYAVNLAADPQVIVDIPDLLAQLGIDLDELSVADLDPAQLGLGDVLKEAGIDLSTLVAGMLGSNLPIKGSDITGERTCSTDPNPSCGGFKIIMTGPLMGGLRALGGNPFWTGSTPKDIADAIINTPYGVRVTSPLTLTLPTWRVPVVVGMGLGAFAAGESFDRVVAEFNSQAPNNNKMILPMILLFNPGRANGGLFARFDPVAQMFGFSTVTDDVVSQRIDHNPGASPVQKAVLFPVKVDGTVEYFVLSDFPAWGNPFSVANSAASLAFPTYMLRGNTLDDIITPIMNGALGAITTSRAFQIIGGNAPAAVNTYITVRAGGLPLLEPLRLPVDAINLALGTNLTNPFADAIEPALKLLVNLGYTDVDQTDPTYDRTLDDAGTPTPFGTMPDIDWERVPEDLIKALETGIRSAFFNGGIPGMPSGTPNPKANPLKNLADLLGGLGGGTSALNDLNGLSDQLNAKIVEIATQEAAGQEQAAVQANSPASVPDLNAPTVDVATPPAPQVSTLNGDLGTQPKVAAGNLGDAAKQVRSELSANTKKANERAQVAVKQVRDQVGKTVKRVSDQLNDVSDKVQKEIKKVVHPDQPAKAGADKE